MEEMTKISEDMKFKYRFNASSWSNSILKHMYFRVAFLEAAITKCKLLTDAICLNINNM